MSRPYTNLKGDVKFKRINLYGMRGDFYTFRKPSQLIWREYERLAKVIKDDIIQEELGKLNEQIAFDKQKAQMRRIPDFDEIVKEIVRRKDEFEGY